ncbi:unnamed protein product, partial [Effrenium voratum]
GFPLWQELGACHFSVHAFAFENISSTAKFVCSACVSCLPQFFLRSRCQYASMPGFARNVDYAFLMYYAASLSPLYLQIEDDINFAPHWISKITGYISSSYPPTFRSKENAPWRLIDFSQLGFIGKMFQASELTRLAQFLLLFYDTRMCCV